jgi:hypothetical protein
VRAGVSKGSRLELALQVSMQTISRPAARTWLTQVQHWALAVAAGSKWIDRCGESISDVKVYSRKYTMTAQWQHAHRQFHLPFLLLILTQTKSPGCCRVS